MRECRADQHAEEGNRTVRRALACQNELTQRAAASQHSRKADNIHAKNVPQVLGMRDRLTGKTEVETAVHDIIDRHHGKQSRDNADKIEILHQDEVADAACKAHTALLRERTDNERHDQRKDNRRMLAARALGADRVSAGRYADYEQNCQQDWQNGAADWLGLIGTAERKAFLEEERAGRHAACKADERDPCIQVTGGHTQHHAERAAEEHECADHHRSAQNKTHHRRRTGSGLVLPGQQRQQERAADKANDLRAEILHRSRSVQLERARCIADKAGNADRHVGRVAVNCQKHDQ